MTKNNIPTHVGKILREMGETPETCTWETHGTLCVTHKALERVAALKNISFDPPTIIESDVASKNVVIVVTGHMNDKSQWSFGEAANYNNKNLYPYAMAEKRAKDRVILKLVGLHGYVYSEDESEAMANARPSEIVDVPEDIDIVEHNSLVRDHIETISLAKEHIANEEYALAKGCLDDFDQEIKEKLWRAPSRGGMWTTQERKIMQSTEFRLAGTSEDAAA